TQKAQRRQLKTEIQLILVQRTLPSSSPLCSLCPLRFYCPARQEREDFSTRLLRGSSCPSSLRASSSPLLAISSALNQPPNAETRMTPTPTAQQILDTYFLETRAKLIE